MRETSGGSERFSPATLGDSFSRRQCGRRWRQWRGRRAPRRTSMPWSSPSGHPTAGAGGHCPRWQEQWGTANTKGHCQIPALVPPTEQHQQAESSAPARESFVISFWVDASAPEIQWCLKRGLDLVLVNFSSHGTRGVTVGVRASLWVPWESHRP